MQEVINLDLNKIKEEQVDTFVICLLETLKKNIDKCQDKEYIDMVISKLEDDK